MPFEAPHDPLLDELATLQEENAALRAQLQAAYDSTSYRTGNRLVRLAARVVPGRSPGRTPAPPAPRRRVEQADGTSQPQVQRATTYALGRDDVLLDADGSSATQVAATLARLRAELPDHATVVVVHADADVVADQPGTAHVVPGHAHRFRQRFGPARTLRLVDAAGATELLASPAAQLVRRTVEDPDPTEGLPAGPVFIGGTGRSGTWVIGRMLNAHPRFVTVHTELRFHSSQPGFASVLDGSRTPEEYAELVARKWHRPSGGDGKPKGLQLLVGPPVLHAALERFLVRAREDVPAALGQLLLDLVDPYAGGRDALEWAETTPDNAAAAGALTAVLPQAKVVHTVRDGRDVAASVVTMPWGPETIEDGLDWWARRIRRAHEGARAAPGRVHVVRLEQLVHLDREAQYEQLVAFLGFRDDAPLRRYFEQQMDGDRGNVGRWRGQVEATERDRIDGRYRELLDELRADGVTCLPTDADAIDDLGGATTHR